MNATTRVPPSTAEVLKRQAENAARLRAEVAQKRANAAPPAKQASVSEGSETGTAIAPANSSVVALPDSRTAVQAYLDEIAPSAFSGRLVKFNKDGKFATPDTGDVIDENADFMALCDEVQVGWIKFNGENAPPVRIQGLLYEGFVMPLRDALGDTDETKWETGLSGQPQDPWQHQMSLVLQEVSTQEIFTFTTTSQTGRRAVGALLRHYERLRRVPEELYPVVRLKTGGFEHKDPRVGWVATPQFVVVGKAPKNTAVKPDTSVGADMNDAIAF
jgi:hypothetical protein